MNITDIRAALKRSLDMLDGWQIYDYEPDAPNAPCIICVPDEPFMDPYLAMQGGLAELKFRLTILVPHTVTWSHQARLDGLISAGADSPDSVFDRLDADTTLGAVVSMVKLERVGNYGNRNGPDGTRYLGADAFITARLPRT